MNLNRHYAEAVRTVIFAAVAIYIAVQGWRAVAVLL